MKQLPTANFRHKEWVKETRQNGIYKHLKKAEASFVAEYSKCLKGILFRRKNRISFPIYTYVYIVFIIVFIFLSV